MNKKMTETTDTADRVAMRLSLGIVGPEYPIENVRSCANDLLGLGLWEAIEWLEGKDSDEFWIEERVELALAALKGEAGKQQEIEARRTLKAEEQADE